MTIPVSLAGLLGSWKGNNNLWVFPTDHVRASDTTMVVASVAQGKFAAFQYTWVYEGAPQDGLLVVSADQHPDVAQSFWIDSWHMQDKFMRCQGGLGKNGEINLKGSYEAPPGPDWGWQIDIRLKQDGTLLLEMHNITPDGISQLAVEAAYSRN
jgi:Protein of unknown function (DUF1579)